jgi:hypothetical protein
MATASLIAMFGLGCSGDSNPLPLVTQPTQSRSNVSAEDPPEKNPPTKEEKEEATRRLDKAILAHGGPTRLAKLQSMVQHARGTMGPLAAEQTLFLRFPDRLRLTTTLTNPESGRDEVALALGSLGGWRKSPGQFVDLSPEEHADTRRELYVQWLMTVLPVRADEFERRPLAETTVEGRALTGISVRSAGHPNVQLFFDKESGLLTMVLIPRWTEAGQQKTREIVLSQFKKFGEITLPTALVDRRNRQQFLEWVTIDYRFEPIDDKVFEKP